MQDQLKAHLKWKCPRCGVWVKEPIGKICSYCRHQEDPGPDQVDPGPNQVDPDNWLQQTRIGTTTMKLMLTTIFAALLSSALAAQSQIAPSLSQPAPELVRADFQKGIYHFECVVYTADKEKIEINGKEESYAPRKCNWLDPSDTTFTEDWTYIRPNGDWWTVQVEFYREGAENPILSNSLRIKR